MEGIRSSPRLVCAVQVRQRRRASIGSPSPKRSLCGGPSVASCAASCPSLCPGLGPPAGHDDWDWDCSLSRDWCCSRRPNGVLRRDRLCPSEETKGPKRGKAQRPLSSASFRGSNTSFEGSLVVNHRSRNKNRQLWLGEPSGFDHRNRRCAMSSAPSLPGHSQGAGQRSLAGSDAAQCSFNLNMSGMAPARWGAGRGVTAAQDSSETAVTSEDAAGSLAGPTPAAELPTVSVVIPVFNEVQSIPILVERVGDALLRTGWPHEIIVVDDGSTDGSTALLKCLAKEKPEVRTVVLRCNFGQSAAMMAGFDYASGELIVTLDGDLQNDPDDIPRLLSCLVFGKGGLSQSAVDRAEEGDAPSSEGGAEAVVLPVNGGAGAGEEGGFDLVCGWRRHRKDDPIRRNLPSAVANFLIGRLTGVRLHDYGCSLKAYRGKVARSLRLYGELHRFIPALAAMEGATICEVPVSHHPRRTGVSKYGLSRFPRVLLDLSLVLFLRSFRDRPIQFFGALAALPLLVSAVFLSLFCSTMLRTGLAYGWGMALGVGMPHLVATLEFFVAALLLLCLGLVADLCMRTFYESQDRPVYRVREVAMWE